MPRNQQPVTFDVIWPACIHCGACVAVCLQGEPFILPFDTIAVAILCAIAGMRCVAVCPTSAVAPQPLAAGAAA